MISDQLDKAGSYSAVSHDNHMQATCRESDWCVDIQNKPQKALDVYQTLLLLEGRV